MLGRVTPDPPRLDSLRLPPQSRMAQRAPYGVIDPASDDEVWLRDEPAPVCVHVPHAHPTPTPPSALVGARLKPSRGLA